MRLPEVVTLLSAIRSFLHLEAVERRAGRLTGSCEGRGWGCAGTVASEQDRVVIRSPPGTLQASKRFTTFSGACPRC